MSIGDPYNSLQCVSWDLENSLFGLSIAIVWARSNNILKSIFDFALSALLNRHDVILSSSSSGGRFDIFQGKNIEQGTMISATGAITATVAAAQREPRTGLHIAKQFCSNLSRSLSCSLFFLNGPVLASFSLFSSIQHTVDSIQIFNI